MPDEVEAARATEAAAHKVGWRHAVVPVIVVVAGVFAAGYVVGSRDSDDEAAADEVGGPLRRVECPWSEPANPRNCDSGSTFATICTVMELRERIETGEIAPEELPGRWPTHAVPVHPTLGVDLSRLERGTWEDTEQDLRNWFEESGVDIVPVVHRCADGFDPDTDLPER